MGEAAATPPLIARLAGLDPADRSEIVAALCDGEEFELGDGWAIWGQRAQLPPPWRWPVWMILAGRGFGKTRSGAEWVHWMAQDPEARIALIGSTDEDARRVMIEGTSGLLSTGPVDALPDWEPSRGLLRWPNGARAHVYSAANPESLRGPEHSHAWCDEIGKWPRGEAAWDNLRMGMRRGRRPQIVVTTTPRPTPLIRRIMGLPGIAITRGRTADNTHLPTGFVAEMDRTYRGTRLGRQELDGELIDDIEGALWTRSDIEACRVRAAPALTRVVVGVDPPASAGGDACGIVVVGLGEDGLAYVMADASVAGRSPEGWAAAVAQAAEAHGADRVVAEKNNGGDMVESVLRAADAGLPVKLVHAAHGKVTRAEPIAALYARGRVKHAGAFPALEDELCGLVTGGGYEGPGRSPDRADALVWAMTELMLGKRGNGPRIGVV